MNQRIFLLLPNFIQNVLISVFNILAYRTRYGGKYSEYLALFKNNRKLSADQLAQIQKDRYSQFVKEVVEKSPFYEKAFGKIEGYSEIKNIINLPILTKEMLRKEINDIQTISKRDGVLYKTGGTTGKSLEVLFTKFNVQERYAMLDDFRARFGYKLGKKTAWFSGKHLLNRKDMQRHRFWKTDFLYNVRYYSTFHIKESFLKYYINDLIKYQPEYIVGFPSSLLEIAKYGLQHNIHFPQGILKAIFPTAETITESTRLNLESFFGAPLVDQYASSEGAPFIFECEKGNLHLELQSGVFEVLDEKGNSAKSGRLVVTSFTTLGAPLIRYDIGDSITLSQDICQCSNNNPLVKEILGRVDDYIYSPANGKVNLGNISNTLKDTSGIKKFQVTQDALDEILLNVEIDSDVFNKNIEEIFIKNWRDRVGSEMTITLHYVEGIAVETSGKFRIVKNNIKHLIEGTI